MNAITISKRYNTQHKCIMRLEYVRWGNHPKCPYCKSDRSSALKNVHRHHCNACNKSYSVLVGTIFEDTKLPLPKWFMAISLILNAKKGISSRQLARDINVNKDTAWYLQMRVRNAMSEGDVLLTGLVEIDETYIGGALRNKTKKYRIAMKASQKTITGMEHKKPVLGMVERGGKVITQALKKAHDESIKPVLHDCIKQSATVITDGFGGYYGLDKTFSEHQVVNHEKEEFVRGIYHTNTIEGFWSMLKRAVIGQYHQISGKYLQLYANECGYKYNNRKNPYLFQSFLMAALSVNST